MKRTIHRNARPLINWGLAAIAIIPIALLQARHLQIVSECERTMSLEDWRGPRWLVFSYPRLVVINPLINNIESADAEMGESLSALRFHRLVLGNVQPGFFDRLGIKEEVDFVYLNDVWNANEEVVAGLRCFPAVKKLELLSMDCPLDTLPYFRELEALQITSCPKLNRDIILRIAELPNLREFSIADIEIAQTVLDEFSVLRSDVKLIYHP
ncbi:MAG: hypothetical protein R3F19_00990 [Verrucomicrobiales bacterium]